MGLAIRLIRALPLIVILALLAGVLYVTVATTRSATRAKEVLIKVFFWLNSVLSVLFILACLYALLEQNQDVLELFAAFLFVSAVALCITLACRAVFLKNHPSYRKKPKPARLEK